MSRDTGASDHAAFPGWPYSQHSIQPFRPVINPAADLFERTLFVAFVVIGFVMPTISEVSGSNIPQDLFWIMASTIVSLTFVRDRKGISASMRSSAPLILLLSLAVLSTAWSDDPSTTLRRSLALVAAGAISLCLGRRFKIDRFLQTLATACAILAIINIACIVLVPEIGLAPDGEWKGLLGRKNTLAEFTVLGITTLSCTMPYLATIQRYAAFAAIALMLLLLIGANSAASIIIALALGIFAPTVVWARSKYAGRPRFLVVVALCSLAIIAVLSTVGEEAVLDAVGKDATFTGRTDVWQFSVDAIRERPLLGYGYKVFWLNNGAADPTGRTTTWATGAHNGLIDIGLDLGLTGILVAIIFVAVAIRNSLRFFWTGRDLPTSWPLFVFFSFVLTNVTEGKIASYYDVSWVVVVAAFYYTAEPTERCTP